MKARFGGRGVGQRPRWVIERTVGVAVNGSTNDLCGNGNVPYLGCINDNTVNLCCSLARCHCWEN
jgi:hypothetical protein